MSLKFFLSFIFKIAFLVFCFLTIMGLFAPIFPFFDLINHFRLFIIIGSFISLVSIILLKHSFLAIATACLFAINLMLAGIAWSYAKPLTFASSAFAQTSDLKLISFNILYTNKKLENVEKFFRDENADIIFLQEYQPHHKNLLDNLKKTYPFQYICQKAAYCGLAVLSKHPFFKLKSHARSFMAPAVISAVFKLGKTKEVHIIGTHISWPFKSIEQSWNLKWLADFTDKVKMPLIVVGDFNHTPWSWRLTKFAYETGLKRHATFLNSWPSFSRYPFLLIDHIFSSNDISNIDTKVGPYLGSDHLPIISRFAL